VKYAAFRFHMFGTAPTQRNRHGTTPLYIMRSHGDLLSRKISLFRLTLGTSARANGTNNWNNWAVWPCYKR